MTLPDEEGESRDLRNGKQRQQAQARLFPF